MGPGSYLASAFGGLFGSGSAAEEEPEGTEPQQGAWAAQAALGGPKRKVPGPFQPSDGQQPSQGGLQGWGDLRRSKRFCSADELAALAGMSVDAPQDQALAPPASAGWAGCAAAPGAAPGPLHAVHYPPAAFAEGCAQPLPHLHTYDLRSGSSAAGAAWPPQQRACPPLRQQQQAPAHPAPSAALPPRHPQWPGGLRQRQQQQQQQQQAGWGASSGGVPAAATAERSTARFGAVMPPPPASAAGLASLLPHQPHQQHAAAGPVMPQVHARQQAGPQPAFAHLPGFPAAAAPRAALPGYVVQRVLPAPAAAASPVVALAQREEESQEEAWDRQSFLTASEGSLTDDASLTSSPCSAAAWSPPAHPRAGGAHAAAPTPPPSPAGPPAGTESGPPPGLLAGSPPPLRPDTRRQELVQQLREANAALESIALPEGCPYIPLHESDALLEPAAFGWCIPPIAVALGGSYFARLLHQSPDMQAQAVASGFLVRVPVRTAAAPGTLAPAILMLRTHAGNPSLFSVFATCVYLAAKVADRVQYQRELSSMLSALLGSTVGTAEAEAMELTVLRALQWRLGPVFDLGPALGPY